MLLFYWLIGKRILYNIPIGEKYFYSEMIMHTQVMNKFESTSNISITKISLLTIYQSSDSKDYNYLASYQNSSISIDKILLWCIHQCTDKPMCKQLCGH